MNRPSTSANLAGLPDGQLIARCRTGDSAAWNALVERFSRYVHAIAVGGYRLSPADAEDVFQEVFARTHQHLDRLRDDDAVRPWIGQLTRRLCVDALRSRSRTVVGEPIGDGALDPMLERLDAAMDVRRAMGDLPATCQEILDRFFARDESYLTIAGALDIAAGTVASRISRCLERLRRGLEGRNPPPRAS